MDPDHRPAHSCKHCQRIVLRYENFVEDVCPIEIPYTGSEVRRAVEDGCKLFRLFFFADGNGAYDGEFALEDAIKGQVVSNLSRYNTVRRKISELRALPKARRWTGKFFVVISSNEGQFELPSGKVMYLQYERLEMHRTCMSIKASPGIAAVQLANYLETAQNPFIGSEYSLRKAREWLTKCHDNHDLCPRITGSFVPTRLLKIEFDGAQMCASLVDNLTETHCMWAALTYVWGGDQEFQTTLSSLPTMKEKFHVRRLPQTIQDALTVCNGLNLKFLWVDCLCIIQNDAQDLARELAAMPQIYQQAWVTISASTASSADDGFLHDRGYKTHGNQTPISLPYACNDGVNSGTIIIGEGSAPSVAEQNNRLPIHHRAWTYQERRLSPRILDFTNRNLTFICRTGKRCQGHGSMLWTSPEAGLWKAQQHNIPCLEDQDLPTWHSVVVGYMNRKLTFSNDKLKAIAALADVYRIRTKKTYVAGLWKESLIRDMCWRMLPSASLSTTNSWLPRPANYLAPSWSWASVVMREGYEFEFFPSNYAEVKADAVIRHISLKQEPPNTTYGHIESGYLIVEGLASNVIWFYNQASLELGHQFVTTSRDALESFWGDCSAERMLVTALILTRGKMTHYYVGHFIFGLLLVERTPGSFQRVGTFHSSVNAWGSEAIPELDKGFKRQTFTII